MLKIQNNYTFLNPSTLFYYAPTSVQSIYAQLCQKYTGKTKVKYYWCTVQFNRLGRPTVLTSLAVTDLPYIA